MNSKWKKISLFSALVALVSLSIAAILFFTTGIVAMGERKTVTINQERYFDLEGIEAIDLSTTSGEVRARGLKTEEAEFSSVSGDIRIKGFEGDIALKITSGKTAIDYASFDNTVQISSISGDVRLGLPQTAEFRLNARSTSGDIDCDFPITMTDSSGSRRSIEGTVGSGTNTVIIKTVSGDIDIKS